MCYSRIMVNLSNKNIHDQSKVNKSKSKIKIKRGMIILMCGVLVVCIINYIIKYIVYRHNALVQVEICSCSL